MYRILSLLLICFLLGCKKETIISYELEPEVKEITLTLELNDNMSLLNWNKYEGKGFLNYHIIKQVAQIEKGAINYSQSVAATINDINTTSLGDTLPEDYPEVSYYVVVEVSDDIQRMVSNKVFTDSKGPYTRGNYDDILINEEHQLLYFLNRSNGIISSYSYADQTYLNTDFLKMRIGYSSLGSYGAERNELYVPTSDGWIYILDAVSLEHKDRIYVGAEEIYSIASAGEFLIASCSDNRYHSDSALKIFRRGDKKMTDFLTIDYIARNIYLNRSSYEFVDISSNLIPYANSHYVINNKGKIIKQQGDSYHGDYPLDPTLFISFPNGKKFITSAQGAIYNSDLTFEKMLTNFYENKYQDYAISEDETKIYAALRETNQIEVFDYPSLNQGQPIFTKLVPFKVFSVNDYLIIVSRQNGYASYNNTIYAIEKIDR